MGYGGTIIGIKMYQLLIYADDVMVRT